MGTTNDHLKPACGSDPGRSCRRRSGAAAFAALLFAPAVLAAGSAQGYYTEAQARHGSEVFSANCAQCHGARLQGQAGPALAGKSFEDSLEYSKMSAKQLFSFISSQMPYNDPGSLKKEQYLQVLAFILKKNGYPSGSTPLSESLLGHVRLLPYPQGKHSVPDEAHGKSPSD